MKIIMSRAVLEESHKVGSEIAQMIVPGFPVQSLDEQIEDASAVYGPLKHMHYRVDLDGGVEVEVSDTVVIAVLRLYSRFAGVVNAIVQTVKVMLPMLKSDVQAVNALITERH